MVATVAVALAATAVLCLLAASIFRARAKRMACLLRLLEASLKASEEKVAAERRGRTRAQQDLRKALLARRCVCETQQASHSSFPFTPIAVVQSCFSTRNGTPRQPLLVPLARACVVLNTSRVPLEALEGLSDYSHCWVLYVFHLNTDLDKLWKEPSRSKFKAKVRVPRLKGGKIGVLATRSPHRPCPIGLTVAKVEAVDGCNVLLSGVDLVDGTPVLDIKPYLPYSDSIQAATVPKWLEENNSLIVASVSFSPEFRSTLTHCWEAIGKNSLYATPDELQSLIEQALSWDIRSISQQTRPHNTVSQEGQLADSTTDDTNQFGGCSCCSPASLPSGDIIYHIVLEGIDISYKVDANSNIMIGKASLSSDIKCKTSNHCSYTTWRNKLR